MGQVKSIVLRDIQDYRSVAVFCHNEYRRRDPFLRACGR
jgi:hypothetical protein